MTLEKFLEKLSETPKFFGHKWSLSLCREFRLCTDNGSYCPITAVAAMELNQPHIKEDEAANIGLEVGLSIDLIDEIISAADFFRYNKDFEKENPLLLEMIEAVKGVGRNEA